MLHFTVESRLLGLCPFATGSGGTRVLQLWTTGRTGRGHYGHSGGGECYALFFVVVFCFYLIYFLFPRTVLSQ